MLYSQGYNSANKSSILAFAAFFVLLRTLPPLPLYRTSGDVNEGVGADWAGSGAGCSAGGARPGVSLPGILSTRVIVLFRPIGVEGRLGQLGSTSISSPGIIALILPLLVILSASNRSLSLALAVVSLRVLILL